MNASARAADPARGDDLRVQQTDPAVWREAVETELRRGGRFLGLYATARDGAPEVCCLLGGQQTVVLRTSARAGFRRSSG